MNDAFISRGDPFFRAWTVAWAWHARSTDSRAIFDANLTTLLAGMRMRPSYHALTMKYLPSIRRGKRTPLRLCGRKALSRRVNSWKSVVVATLIVGAGLVGSGWATTIVRCAMLVAIAGFLMMHRTHRVHGMALRPRLAAVRRIFAVGGPIGAQFGMEVGLFSFAAVMMGWLGAVETRCAATRTA